MPKKRQKAIAEVIANRKDIVALLDGTQNIDTLFDIPSPLPDERLCLYRELYEGIGKTPCYTAHLPNGNLLRIKMEYANTMGNNHYSRCWIPYLYIAEVLSVITPGETHLLEVTSGSAGISLAMASRALGYKLTLIVPDRLPQGRTGPMQHFNAEIVKVPGYIDKCISKLRRMLAADNYFPCNHSEESADILVKIDKRIAIEYCREFGAPDYCIVGLGNGTSTYAIFDYLQRVAPAAQRITFHPDLEKDDVVFGLYGPNVVLRHIEPALALSSERIITTGTDLCKVLEYFKYDTEISNLGLSSLYAVYIAMEKARKVSNKTFVVIGYDKNDRYK